MMAVTGIAVLVFSLVFSLILAPIVHGSNPFSWEAAKRGTARHDTSPKMSLLGSAILRLCLKKNCAEKAGMEEYFCFVKYCDHGNSDVQDVSRRSEHEMHSKSCNQQCEDLPRAEYLVCIYKVCPSEIEAEAHGIPEGVSSSDWGNVADASLEQYNMWKDMIDDVPEETSVEVIEKSMKRNGRGGEPEPEQEFSIRKNCVNVCMELEKDTKSRALCIEFWCTHEKLNTGGSTNTAARSISSLNKRWSTLSCMDKCKQYEPGNLQMYISCGGGCRGR